MNFKIKAQNITAGYDGPPILKGISVELAERDFVGIIGPNGSGKTTLLRVLSRALAPKSGEVILNGKNIYQMPTREFARRVAVVPQDSPTVFDFTVLEIALMGRSPRLGRFAIEGSKDIKIAMDALARTSTAHLKDRPIGELSGGERQRVMMARALAQEPELLLLDEPTSHLDISYQFEIMDLVKSLNKERGLTVLAVLHDLNLASQYCGRLVIIGDGQIQADGTPEQVITSDNIRRIYGAEVWVRKHPATHRPYVISGIKPKTPPPSEGFDKPLQVHVVGGGGTAAPILARLARRGYAVTCGVLSNGDADHEVAEALDIPHISQPLFSEITPESQKANEELMDNADVIILMDVPVGHGNLANIESVLKAAQSGKKTIILKPDLISTRDFTGGRAAELINQLARQGAEPTDSIEIILSNLEYGA